MIEMSLEEALEKGRKYAKENRDVPSVSRTLSQHIDSLIEIGHIVPDDFDGCQPWILYNSNREDLPEGTKIFALKPPGK